MFLLKFYGENNLGGITDAVFEVASIDLDYNEFSSSIQSKWFKLDLFFILFDLS